MMIEMKMIKYPLYTAFLSAFLLISTGFHAQAFEIIAHRGAHVMWKQGTYDVATGCEATHIYSPPHEYIENTLPSIAKAFEWGATIVEIDIRRSKDNQLMVIHEYDLACKTNGKGLVSEHDAAYLKTLDVGYGFTPDGGKTYPFRGKGVGLMPTLKDVLEAFPNKKFLIDHKDRSAETAALLADFLSLRSQEQNNLLYYWGDKEDYLQISRKVPQIRRLFPNRAEIKDCVMPYFLSFGIFGFKSECKGQNIGMNRKYAKQIWGWPHHFLAKAKENQNPVFLMVDHHADIEYFKGLPVAGVITDYIHLVGPYYAQKQTPETAFSLIEE